MFTCRTCHRPKDEAQFFRQSGCKRGHMAECKPCSMRRNKRWQKRNPERTKELAREASARHRRNDPRLALLATAKGRAAKAGMPFDIGVDDLEWPSHCPVLGTEMTSTFGLRTGPKMANSPSLDRIDNTKGYVKGNVVVVSWRANRIKCDATPDELRKVADFYGRLP